MTAEYKPFPLSWQMLARLKSSRFDGESVEDHEGRKNALQYVEGGLQNGTVVMEDPLKVQKNLQKSNG